MEDERDLVELLLLDPPLVRLVVGEASFAQAVERLSIASGVRQQRPPGERLLDLALELELLPGRVVGGAQEEDLAGAEVRPAQGLPGPAPVLAARGVRAGERRPVAAAGVVLTTQGVGQIGLRVVLGALADATDGFQPEAEAGAHGPVVGRVPGPAQPPGRSADPRRPDGPRPADRPQLPNRCSRAVTASLPSWLAASGLSPVRRFPSRVVAPVISSLSTMIPAARRRSPSAQGIGPGR